MPRKKSSPKVATLQLKPTLHGETILLFGRSLSIDEARLLVIQLKALFKQSSAQSSATLAHTSFAEQMFRTADDGSVFTVRVEDEAALQEIRQALNVPAHGIVPTIAALMEFHKENESLNILLAERVLEGSSYINYTGQFAQQISKHTQEFLKIRVIYDKPRAILGIFCRQTEFDISVTFRGQLVNTLRQKGIATLKIIDMPETYQDYPSMLIYFIKKRLPGRTITYTKTKTALKIIAQS